MYRYCYLYLFLLVLASSCARISKVEPKPSGTKTALFDSKKIDDYLKIIDHVVDSMTIDKLLQSNNGDLQEVFHNDTTAYIAQIRRNIESSKSATPWRQVGLIFNLNDLEAQALAARYGFYSAYYFVKYLRYDQISDANKSSIMASLRNDISGEFPGVNPETLTNSGVLNFLFSKRRKPHIH